MGLWDKIVDMWTMARGKYKYSPLPTRERVREAQQSLTFWASNHHRVLKATMAVMGIMIMWYLIAATV